MFRIYAWEMLDTIIPFDLILSRKGSDIHELADLEGKKIGTFPGSQLKHYLELANVYLLTLIKLFSSKNN